MPHLMLLVHYSIPQSKPPPIEPHLFRGAAARTVKHGINEINVQK